MTTAPENRAAAKDVVNLCASFGALAVIAGAWTMVVQVPRTEVSLLGEVTEKGSHTVFLIGVLVASGGALLLSVAIVALGVMLGTRMARD